jgi:hypothetical protein
MLNYQRVLPVVSKNQMGLSENVVYPQKPNGFADHYPYFLWLFHWGYSPFSDIPRSTKQGLDM